MGPLPRQPAPVVVGQGSRLLVLNVRSDEQSAFVGLFRNHWLWAALGLPLALHGAVIYVPFPQQAFSTVDLSAGDWARCAVVASSALWLRELSKIFVRVTGHSPAGKRRAV